MDEIFAKIAQYLNQEKVPPNLVFQVELSSLKPILFDMGFNQNGDYFTISKSDAETLMKKHLGIRDFNWNKHWEQERKRPLG